MYYTVIKHSDHLRTLDKCRKHSPAARVFYISLVFSNARRVLSQCNTRLRLLYLLSKNTSQVNQNLVITMHTRTSPIFFFLANQVHVAPKQGGLDIIITEQCFGIIVLIPMSTFCLLECRKGLFTCRMTHQSKQNLNGTTVISGILDTFCCLTTVCSV